MFAVSPDSPFTLAGGAVIDGTGASSYPGNVAIEGDRIVAVAADVQPRGAVIDCTGLAVSPGFIDMHSHSDLVCMSEPRLAAKLRQGITTEVLGQDGLSEAPIPPEHIPMWRRHLSGLNGDPDLPWDWRSFGDYLGRCNGAAINMTGWWATDRSACTLPAWKTGQWARRSSTSCARCRTRRSPTALSVFRPV